MNNTEPIKTKEELINILRSADFSKHANLWKGAYMDEHYKQYEVAGFSHPQQWEDGTWHTYDGVYSLNDGQISDKMREVITYIRKNIYGGANVWIFTNPETKDEQGFFIYHNGTNGLEGNALNSIREMADSLEDLQNHSDWATLLDCYCDTCDDVYSWLFTFTV